MPIRIERGVAVVTGACGGMGQALARAFGGEMDLVLTDVDPTRLEAFSHSLYDEGYTVAASLAGDLAEQDHIAALCAAQARAGPLQALLHTAGLSPAMADWRTILKVNLIATELLLRGFEAQLAPGAAAVLIASQAGHIARKNPEIDAVAGDPLAEDFYSRMQPLMAASPEAQEKLGLSWAAYAYSKRAVIRICEARAKPWGDQGARIVSLSPGLIWTPMGQMEIDESPGAGLLLEATPAGRWGTPIDIAAAARFLASAEAGFISGADLRIDGGGTPGWVGPLF